MMALDMSESILNIEALTLKRNEREILRDVNLKIYPGEVHALLGLNGSGKSSLAYTIMGCDGYAPDAGRIVFDGTDLNGLSITQRARLGITLAWQEPARFEGIPVGKYVELGTNPPNREKVIAALDAVALPVKVYGYRAADRTLSGGERKRVELAAVYAHAPAPGDFGRTRLGDRYSNPDGRDATDPPHGAGRHRRAADFASRRTGGSGG